MDRVFVREGTSDDDSAIMRLSELACNEQQRLRGSWVLPPGTTPDGKCITLVGGLGDTVFGTIRVREGVDGAWGVELLHVEEPARGVGIGDALLADAMARLSADGVGSLTASAQPGDRSLKNLFERHGLVARTILVSRNLRD